jgi:hypothetical protein
VSKNPPNKPPISLVPNTPQIGPKPRAWYRLHNSLNDLFPEVQPWIFPCIESPDAWVGWESVPDARARYDALMVALEARNKARSSRRALGAPGRVARVPN